MRTLVVFVFIIMLSSFREDGFEGRFTISVTSEEFDPVTMAWTTKDNLAMMDLGTDQSAKGVPKQLLLNTSDTTVSLLMSFGNYKRGTKLVPVKIRKHQETKRIGSHTAQRVTMDSKEYFSELWITPELSVDIFILYRMMTHCSLINRLALNGDWYQSGMPGTPLEIATRNKKTGKRYLVKVENLTAAAVASSVFDLAGYKISEIAPGQNCGTMVPEAKEKK